MFHKIVIRINQNKKAKQSSEMIFNLFMMELALIQDLQGLKKIFSKEIYHNES